MVRRARDAELKKAREMAMSSRQGTVSGTYLISDSLNLQLEHDHVFAQFIRSIQAIMYPNARRSCENIVNYWQKWQK